MDVVSSSCETLPVSPNNKATYLASDDIDNIVCEGIKRRPPKTPPIPCNDPPMYARPVNNGAAAGDDQSDIMGSSLGPEQPTSGKCEYSKPDTKLKSFKKPPFPCRRPPVAPKPNVVPKKVVRVETKKSLKLFASDKRGWEFSTRKKDNL